VVAAAFGRDCCGRCFLTAWEAEVGAAVLVEVALAAEAVVAAGSEASAAGVPAAAEQVEVGKGQSRPAKSPLLG